MSVQSQTQLLPAILVLRRLWQKLSSELKVNLGNTPCTKPPAKTKVLLYRCELFKILQKEGCFYLNSACFLWELVLLSSCFLYFLIHLRAFQHQSLPTPVRDSMKVVFSASLLDRKGQSLNSLPGNSPYVFSSSLVLGMVTKICGNLGKRKQIGFVCDIYNILHNMPSFLRGHNNLPFKRQHSRRHRSDDTRAVL